MAVHKGLPKLVGIQKSLDMMLTGKQLRAKQALKAGLVNDVVPNSILIATAEKLALSGKVKPKARKLSFMDKMLEGNTVSDVAFCLVRQLKWC